MTVKVEAGDCVFNATGTRILFPGFLRVYVEGSDDPEAALEDKEVLLPPLKPGETVQVKKLEALSHDTKAPARFTEASLVQALEKEGIGRPSTYASIIGTILERNYVNKLGNALAPTFTGFAVVQFLERHFAELVDYGFTSQMEESLDEIAGGQRPWLPYLEKFYLGERGLREQIKHKEDHIDPDQSRTVHLGHLDGVDIRVGRFGPYLVKPGSGEREEDARASIPEGVAPGDLDAKVLHDLLEAQEKGPQSLGQDPETGLPIYVMLGRFGPYVQLGETPEDKKIKPKRASVPKGVEPKSVTLEMALRYLSLPRVLGMHPETGDPISANVGRFGPYVVHQKDFRSLKKDDDVYTVNLDRALEILSEPKKGRGGASALKELGLHPQEQKNIAIYEGRYGPYIKYGTLNVSLPKERDPQTFTLEEALALLEKKRPAGKKAAKSKKR